MAQSKYVICMDGDLQHPPEKVPEFLKVLLHASTSFHIHAMPRSVSNSSGLFEQYNSMHNLGTLRLSTINLHSHHHASF
jgi:hypothetical protein